jgi:hypothetical protein
VQVAPPTHDELTAVTVDAVADSRCGEPPPVVNLVEVTVAFQPVPEPVLSLTVIGSV